jgi:hypothetical protein
MSSSSVAPDEVFAGTYVDDLLSLPASTWDKRISADLIAEMEIHLADKVTTIPQMRRILAVKGYLGVFAEVALEGEPAQQALRMLRSLIRGFVLNEMAASFLEPLDYSESFELAIDAFLMGLPAFKAVDRCG